MSMGCVCERCTLSAWVRANAGSVKGCARACIRAVASGLPGLALGRPLFATQQTS